MKATIYKYDYELIYTPVKASVGKYFPRIVMKNPVWPKRDFIKKHDLKYNNWESKIPEVGEVIKISGADCEVKSIKITPDGFECCVENEIEYGKIYEVCKVLCEGMNKELEEKRKNSLWNKIKKWIDKK
jgi:hypothetical protein